MSTPHEQYYDQDRYNRDFDTDDYTDPDDSMSLQDLAVRRSRGYDEDMNRDYSEEAYNEWLMNGGDL